MATAGTLNDDFLNCDICMEVNQEPVTLACQHSFCKSCLQQYLHTRTKALKNKTIPCPTCRQETPVPHPDRPVEKWVGQLKPGLLLTRLMDSVVEDSKHCMMCLEEGKTTPASIWCVDCQACFCEECLKLHNKVPTAKNHDVSKLTKDKQKLKRPFICVKHEKKTKLFCKNCKKSLCTVCCSISHRKCEDVIKIKDMLPEVRSQLLKRQEKLGEGTESNQAMITVYRDEMDKLLMKSASVKTDITKTIQTAVDHLHEKEAELLKKLDVQTDQQAEKLRSKIKTKETETQMYQQQSQFIQQALELEDEAQLFEMYLSSGTRAVADITDTQGEGKSDVTDFTFIHDIASLKRELIQMDVRFCNYTIDRLNTIDLAATPILHEVIDAKVDETDYCEVRDVVVMNISDVKVMMFSDLYAQRLKSVYQKAGKSCLSVLQVSGRPWCMAVIGERKVAVSLHNRKHIITVAVTPDLELLSTIQTSKKYRGLSSLDQSTLVAGSDSPPSVDLIDMQGNIMKAFTTLPTIAKSFSNPHYIHVTRQGAILVSDYGLKSVICLTQSGDIVFTYTPTGFKALKAPYGITTTSTGDILVADYSAHKVIHLSNTGHFIRDLLTAKNGLNHPFGLCVDEDKLCVTVAAKGLHKYKFGTQ